MLRINLLPAYIAERRKRNLAIVLSVFIVALPCFALVAYDLKVKNDTDQEKAQADDAEQKKSEIDAINTQAQSTLAQVQPIIDKVSFVDNIRFYNTLPGRIYSQAARYTIRQAEYSSMVASGANLSMSGFISGQNGPDAVANFGRYLITFFGNPDITALSVNGLPGYPAASTGTGTATTPGFGGPPGGFGGPPGGFNRGGPPGGGFNGPPGGFNGPPGGFPGAATGAFGATGLNLPALPPQPGFQFSATATLKHSVDPPQLPSALAGGGGGGGFGGPPGGFPGGPPGAFNGPPGGFGNRGGG